MERFWNKVYKTDTCWLWTAAKDKDGYGFFKVNQVMTKAHRMAYELAFGNFDKALFVCHSCDIPSCVNPKHLFLGTITDNNRDCTAKGHNKGHTRHSVEIIHAIRSASGSISLISDTYGVSKKRI